MDDKKRLLNMLNEGKISADDFKVLSAALDKKLTSLMKALYFLLNPFQRVSGMKALLIGFVILVLTSYIGFHAQQYYVNAMEGVDVSMNAHPRVAYTFWLVLYQNMICCLTLSLCYLVFAKIFQRKGLRVIDFFGMVAVARVPWLINGIFMLLVQYFAPDFLHIRDTQLQFSWLAIIFSFQNMLLGLWIIIMYFNALKVSSGLTGSKLWISAVGSFVIASVVGSELTMFFV